MLLWIASTDSLLVLSAHTKQKVTKLLHRLAALITQSASCWLTFDEVEVGFAPRVSVLRGEDADGLRVGVC